MRIDPKETDPAKLHAKIREIEAERFAHYNEAAKYKLLFGIVVGILAFILAGVILAAI